MDARVEQLAGVGPSPLIAGFDALADVGILCRANFTCCGSCLAAEIGAEVTDDHVWYGYLAFHAQDAERLVESEETYLSYGVFPEAYLTPDVWESMTPSARDRWYEETTRTLMREQAFPILERHGMTPEWDGRLVQRILLKHVDYYVSWESVPTFTVSFDPERGTESVTVALEAGRDGPMVVGRSLDPNEDAGVYATWRGTTVHRPIMLLQHDGEDVLLGLTPEAAETWGLRQGHRLGGDPANVRAGYEALLRMLTEAGEYVEWLGTGMEASAVTSGEADIVTIDEVGQGRLLFVRLLDTEDPDWLEGVTLTRDGEECYVGAVTGWTLLDAHTIALQLDDESRAAFGLERETRIVFEEPDAAAVRARVLAMFVEAGELNEQGAAVTS